MANEFDPYREALVMEEVTIWADKYDDADTVERARLQRLLHDSAEEAAELTYQRTHTGFSREITVTDEDLRRIKATAS